MNDPMTLYWFWLAAWSFSMFAAGLMTGWSFPRPRADEKAKQGDQT